MLTGGEIVMLTGWEIVMYLAIIVAIEALVVGAYQFGVRKGERKHAPSFTPPHAEPTPEQRRRAEEIEKTMSNMLAYDVKTAMKRKVSGKD